MRDLGFTRFCNDPELACCQYEKRYFSLQTENAKLRKVVEAARDVVGFGACHDENSLWSIKALQNAIENYEGWKTDPFLVDKKCNQCDSQKVEYVCIDFEFDDKQISAYYCKECAEEYNYICPWCRHGLVELDKEGE